MYRFEFRTLINSPGMRNELITTVAGPFTPSEAKEFAQTENARLTCASEYMYVCKWGPIVDAQVDVLPPRIDPVLVAVVAVFVGMVFAWLLMWGTKW